MNTKHSRFFIAEKKLMPFAVLTAFIIYTCAAIGFSFC